MAQDNFSLEDRNFSFWEKDNLTGNRDFIIIGAGLVGLSTAISIKEKYENASILILERASIPYGASTRNAGFACFGSLSEIVDDLNHLNTAEVEQLINMRWHGLRVLRERIGDHKLSYLGLGGYELFSGRQSANYDMCIDKLEQINDLIYRSIAKSNCFSLVDNPFGLDSHGSLIYNQYEGQLHPGMMIKHLQRIALNLGVEIQYGVDIGSYESTTIGGIDLYGNRDTIRFNASKVIITTNAFTPSLVDSLDLKPGRNQVMMTKPIGNLKISGCFHYDMGYVYFRDYAGRLLIGGGRNIALEEETTEEFGVTDEIRNYLRRLVSEMILPDTPYEEEGWWSGIIATGSNKKPIVKEISANVFVGVRLGGMGVAIGSLIGQELAQLV